MERKHVCSIFTADFTSHGRLCHCLGISRMCYPQSPPIIDSYGPQPHLPEPKSRLLPIVNIAPAKGWPEGTMPIPAAGLKVQAFAKELQHPLAAAW